MMTLFCFDFAGCGLSGGDYISLGWYERDDVELVVDWLRKSDRVSTIGLWGTICVHIKEDRWAQ